MRLEFKPSFERSLKSLSSSRKEQVKEAVEKIIGFLTAGSKTPGLGIKRLRDDFWEARAGIHERVLYRQDRETVEFILAGNHDEIKKFLGKW